MKTLNIPFDDEDYNKLNSAKIDYEGDTDHAVSWKEFLLAMLKSYENE